MSIAADTAASAAIVSNARGAQWLIELDFGGGTVRYTTNVQDIESGGYTYTGYGSLVDVANMTESEDASAQKIVLTFALVNPTMLAATIGNVETYRRRPVRLYLQLVDATYQPVGAKLWRWSGYMEPVRVPRTARRGQGGSTGRIELPCSRAGLSRARGAQGLRLSDAQQRQRYPGDRCYEYIATLIEQPTTWLSKRFQEV